MSRATVTALLLAAAATFLRAQFVFFPPGDHPDETIVATLARRAVAAGKLTANWDGFPDHFWSRPTYQFSPYTLLENAAALAAHRIWGWPTALEDHMRFARWLSVALGGAAVLACYFTARAWFGDPRAAVLAELLLAVAFLHVQDSCYARVEALLSLSVLLTFWAAARAMDLPTLGRCMLLGLLIGFTIAVKYNAAPVLLLALAVRRSPRSLLATLLAVPLGFLLATPEVLADPSPLIQGVRYEVAHYSEGHIPHHAMDASDHNAKFWWNYLARLGFGWAPTVAALAFLMVGARRRGRDRGLALYLLIALVVVLVPKVRFDRNAEILLGPACIAAARLIILFSRGIKRSPVSPFLRAAVIVAVVGNVVQHGLALVDFRHQQKRSSSPLQLIPEAVRRSRYVGQAINKPPPPNWEEYDVLLLSGYSDPFSKRGLEEWRERLKGWDTVLIGSDWYRAGYPFSTVETYHGPGFILRAARRPRSSP